MVCVQCRRRHHEECPGGTWCDCQHQPSQGAQEDQTEPALSWVRQGLIGGLGYIFNAGGGIGPRTARFPLI
jgi:hypothetical protein